MTGEPSRLPPAASGDAGAAGAGVAVAGEGLPGWLAPALGIVGALVAAAAAWLWIDGHLTPPAPAIARAAPAVVADPPPQVAVVPEAAREAAGASGDTGTTSADTGAPAVAAQAAPGEAPAPAFAWCPQPTQVSFPFDSDLPEAPLPNELVALIIARAQHPSARIEVRGHTDPVGTEQYNLMLGWRRARAVAAILIRLGVPASHLDVATAGPRAMPVADAALLRRVDVSVTGLPDCAGKN